MSRYQLTPRTGYENYQCVVGWDRPLATYFAQVVELGRNEDDDIEILWRGTDHAEYPRPDELLAALANWAVVPLDLKSKLLQDRIAKPAPTTPHPWIQHLRNGAESR